MYIYVHTSIYILVCTYIYNFFIKLNMFLNIKISLVKKYIYTFGGR